MWAYKICCPKTHSCHQAPTWRQSPSLSEPITIWFAFIDVISLFFMHKTFLGLVLNVGLGCLLNPTPNTSPKPAHLQKNDAI